MEAATGVASGVTIPELFSLVSPRLTWADLDRLVGDAGLPVLLKGVMTGEDAALACEHGAAGVVVSNHGGRQLDGVAATADLLPEVVEAVAGRVEVLVDGGIRRGTDVLKALALGARAVLVGRPALWGLAAAGEAGAAHVLALLRDEIAISLALLGCASPADVGPGHLHGGEV
jgi:isopentenyl diphosphate isomerase/L-lactate dehydrogenase-like FMN-dependent dehydrogenase